MTSSKNGVPAALEGCQRIGETFNKMSTTFCLSRETVTSRLSNKRISNQRARLFACMAKNATSVTDYFRSPANPAEEIGTQLVI